MLACRIKTFVESVVYRQRLSYLLKSKYAEAGASGLKPVKETEEENSLLKRMYADLALERNHERADCKKR